MSTDFKSRQTPGVYVTELDPFPPSMVGVQTAVPAFVGYTEKAEVSGKPVRLKPVKCGAMVDFDLIFGGAPASGEIFHLYDSLRLFYANGGGECYVVSVGDYSAPVSLKPLQKGLSALENEAEPTMLVIPDAVLLPADSKPIAGTSLPKSQAFATLVQAMLQQAGTLQDRVAILDVYGTLSLPGAKSAEFDSNLTALIEQFRQDVGTEFLSYGAAYFPFLQTSLDGVANPLPPSPALAGVCTLVDTSRGVWNAPANISLGSVTAPTVVINAQQQAELNTPIDGKAVDAIREFVGRGTLVWGARTLDGNSNDYRYIQVRRTLIYIEQSIKAALGQFVFAANDGKTWATVKSMISSFLHQLWAQGGLMGATASEAYSVEVGLGSTMTAQDILDGYMIVQVTLQMIRPAEFIELVFKQKMERST